MNSFDHFSNSQNGQNRHIDYFSNTGKIRKTLTHIHLMVELDMSR
jgi:hypothetical protein